MTSEQTTLKSRRLQESRLA